LVGAICRTLNAVFPQVYVFPAQTSRNLVLVATRAGAPAELGRLRQRAYWLMQTRRVTLPRFNVRLERLQVWLPGSAARSPVLTDDYAPVEGLDAASGSY
jgi:hypothetical protein